eukprot:8005634-Pyramimonas_sp.AAC.1
MLPCGALHGPTPWLMCDDGDGDRGDGDDRTDHDYGATGDDYDKDGRFHGTAIDRANVSCSEP